MAGLAIAALLAGRGQRVTVYERAQAGGKLSRVHAGGLDFSTGPSLFTFPDVWRQFLSRLDEPDPLELRPLPGGLGLHHTPFGPVPLPVPPGHPLSTHWARYVSLVAPLAPHLLTLLTTPPRLGDGAFRRAARALFRVTGPHSSAEGWIRAHGFPAALAHALRTQALNAGLSPRDAPALYALLPALIGPDVFRPANGMGALLETLLDFVAARGGRVLEDSAVSRVGKGQLTLEGGEVVRHDLLVSALDPARLAALRGQPAPSPVARRTVSGVAIYGALDKPSALPATSVVPPGDFGAFRAALRVGALPPDTLALVHADDRRLALLLTAPATGRALDLEHPWVRGQVERVGRVLGAPGLLASAGGAVALTPALYAQGGHPGGAIYGRAPGLWRGGPLHPQPYRLNRTLWQVGTGVHPGGGIPAILGGALIVDRLLREAGY
ncbi:NAD(P)/FAD-dependent oxidoreductase [Deinococcus koreensis]|uniref:NAD(P)/FAD-dependent oxidoreductase n=1 Tax=Deinococcus koreensis TaxID=2054903 RepID=A0A2K3V2Z3_9DEIO|nr:NAD(P)/FAD-dependent oxidoreductase [Deinococcus koreensis]